jgi:hypothetical protein
MDRCQAFDCHAIALGINSRESPYTSQCVAMPTNLAIDDRLIDEVRRIGKHGTKKAVTAALDECIRRRKQLEILDCKKMRQLNRIEIDKS